MSAILGLDYLIEAYLSQEVLPKSEPKRDPYGAYWLHRQDLGVPLVVKYGRIVDTVPYANVYKVQLDQQHTVWASPMVQTSLQPFGAKQLNTYGVGTGVFCFWYRSSHWAWILGAIPDFITSAFVGRSDVISNAGRSGSLVDRCHQEPGKLANNAVNNWSAGRPLDSTSNGEWGAINEHGMKVFLDSYMAILSADEETGVWAFYHDQLLRLAGHNLQLRTALRDHYEFNDQEESSLIKGSTPYPWERLGTWVRGGQGVYLERDANDTMINKPEYCRYEPKYDDQKCFFRSMEFDGYLGQISKKIACLPPYPLPTSGSDLNRYSIPRVLPGVFEENIALTGAYSLRSSKRISIRKRLCGSTPFQNILPEDLRGDNPGNYKHSGLLGSGSDHLIKGEISTPAGLFENLSLIRASSLLDLGAFIFNWEGLHPFHYHSRDWYVPEEGENSQFNSNQYLPPFSYLQFQQYIEAPAPPTVHVDHRYDITGNVKYWPNESGLDFLDDGSVVLYDGFGTELKLTSGSAFLSTPGDFFIQTGRNTNIWAGRDIILKSKWCIDLTSSCKDIRVKAENNLFMLSGNNGCGGTLIENRAKCIVHEFCPNVGEDVIHSGIFLKAKDSEIIGTANEIHLVATQSGLNKPVINIDGAGGKVKVKAEYLERFLTKAAFDFFHVDNDCEYQAVNEWWGTQSLIGTDLGINGQTAINDCLEVNGWISVLNGHIATALSGENNYLVSKVGDIGSVADAFIKINNRVMYLQELASQECVSYNSDPIRILIDKVFFSLRTPAQYKTENFKLFESRWQQLARLNNTIPAVWKEVRVVTECGTHMYSYPYPGNEPWMTQLSWQKLDPNLYDATTGLSKQRGTNQTLYENATYNAPSESVLDGVYPVIL